MNNGPTMPNLYKSDTLIARVEATLDNRGWGSGEISRADVEALISEVRRLSEKNAKLLTENKLMYETLEGFTGTKCWGKAICLQGGCTYCVVQAQLNPA